MPQAPREVERGEGYPLPTGGRVWRGGWPLPGKFFIFLLKIPYLDAF